MIKINLNREGRAAVRGGGAASSAPAIASDGPSNLNNMLVLGLLGLGILAALGYWYLKNREYTERQDRLVVQRAEAQKLESIIKEVDQYKKRKESLESRIALINKLKQNQKGPVRILDRISQDLPDLVWLDRMTLNNGEISIAGRALNPNAAGNFVENIKADPVFEEPYFSGLTRQAAPGGVTVYTFEMTFAFKYAPTEAAGAETAPAAGAEAPTTSPGAAGSKS
ncbi:MAG TPA: PilN domain-containing protein [Thermoanaerobaculia bacterium]|nr:PilN domain-containing protein [Thermoanaerobaculia bacterium]